MAGRLALMSMGEVAEVLVLVKAAPVLTRNLEETMCVAGVRIDGGRCEWIRPIWSLRRSSSPVGLEGRHEDLSEEALELARRGSENQRDAEAYERLGEQVWVAVSDPVSSHSSAEERRDRRRHAVDDLGEIRGQKGTDDLGLVPEDLRHDRVVRRVPDDGCHQVDDCPGAARFR